MAKAASEKDLQLKEAATGKSYTDNIHPTAETLAEAEGSGPKAGLELLTPKGTRVIANGEEFYIKGWQIGDALEVSGELAEFGLTFASIDRNDLPLVMAIIVDKLPTVLRVLEITLKRDSVFVKKIELNEMPELIEAIIENNSSFFRWIQSKVANLPQNPTRTEETPSKSTEENPQ